MERRPKPRPARLGPLEHSKVLSDTFDDLTLKTAVNTLRLLAEKERSGQQWAEEAGDLLLPPMILSTGIAPDLLTRVADRLESLRLRLERASQPG